MSTHMRAMLLVVALLFGSLGLAAPAKAETLLGGLDLIAYCDAMYDTWTPTYESRGWLELVEDDAGGWRCFQATFTIVFSGSGNQPDRWENYYEHGIHMDDACQYQYGDGVWASYSDWWDANSWSCYR